MARAIVRSWKVLSCTFTQGELTVTHRTVLRSVIACIAMLLLSSMAQAQLFRAYLARAGVDTNPCTLPAPCRLLPAALAAVAGSGEIWMLDSANYNTAPVNITKSVTILAVPGALGSVLATGGDAIDIATPGVDVALRNLVIVPQPGGSANNGINMTNGARLTVEDCLIANMPGAGITVNTAANVRIIDSTIRDNTNVGVQLQAGAKATITRATISGNSSYGVFVNENVAGTMTADISDSTLDENGYGVYVMTLNATTTVIASVHDSRIARTVNTGLVADSHAGGFIKLSISENLISNNATGIVADGGGAQIWVSGNTISGNGTGLINISSLIESAGNNAVRNNGFNANGTITAVGTI
jgi:Right handed beta helix region